VGVIRFLVVEVLIFNLLILILVLRLDIYFLFIIMTQFTDHMCLAIILAKIVVDGICQWCTSSDVYVFFSDCRIMHMVLLLR
jgi:hypothetical protein